MRNCCLQPRYTVHPQIYPFKVQLSDFSVFTKLCDHRPCVVPECTHSANSHSLSGPWLLTAYLSCGFACFRHFTYTVTRYITFWIWLLFLFIIYFIGFVCLFFKTVSLCSPGHPGVHRPGSSSFWVLGLNVCPPTPGYVWLLLAVFWRVMCLVANPHFISFDTVTQLCLMLISLCLSCFWFGTIMRNGVMSICICFPVKNVVSFSGRRARGVAGSCHNFNF